MVDIVEPSVDAWYYNNTNHLLFEVVAFEPDEGTIEIQFLSGEVEALDLDDWYRLDIKYSAEPEDWSAPYELDPDQFDQDDKPFCPPKWNNPLDDAGLDR